MKWPFDRVILNSEIPLYNRFYLHASRTTQVDPAMIWGTEIDADALQAFLRECNPSAHVLITTAHALVKATALALAQFPEMNVRVVGRRLHAFRDINIRMAFHHRRNGEMDLLLIPRADLLSLEQISLKVWERLLQAGRGEGGRDRDLNRLRRVPAFWFRQFIRIYNFLDRHMRLPSVGRLDASRAGCAMVNDLSFVGAPPMRSYKPTRFPDQSDSFNLTLGPAEEKVVATAAGQFKSVNVMPLFVRADHRVVDAYQLARFLAVVRDLLNNPDRLASSAHPLGARKANSDSAVGLGSDRFVAANK